MDSETIIAHARDLRTEDDSNPEYDRALVELTVRCLGLSHDVGDEIVRRRILGDR